MGVLSLRSAGTPTHSAATTIVPGLPSSIVAGDILILGIGCATAAESITTPAGWTIFGARGTHHIVYGKIAVGGDTAPTVTLSASGNHSAGMLSLQGDSTGVIGTMAEATNNAFGSSNADGIVPALTIAGQPGFASNNDYILVYTSRVKSATSNGGAWNTLAGYTKIQESYPNGTNDAFTFQALQQTTRADISATAIGITGGTPENVPTSGVIVAIRTATAAAGILRQMMQHSR